MRKVDSFISKTWKPRFLTTILYEIGIFPIVSADKT